MIIRVQEFGLEYRSSNEKKIKDFPSSVSTAKGNKCCCFCLTKPFLNEITSSENIILF